MLLNQKRRVLATTLETTEQRLENSQLAFTRCSPLRRRVRNELRTETELRRRGIVVTQVRLAEARLQIEGARLRPVDPSRERAADEKQRSDLSSWEPIVLERQ
jgi:hypothetical protein